MEQRANTEVGTREVFKWTMDPWWIPFSCPKTWIQPEYWRN